MKGFDRIRYYFTRLMSRRIVSIYDSVIDKKASVGNGAQIYRCSIGRYSYIHNSKVAYSDIGCFCSIAQECVIGGGGHPIKWVSSSPVFYSGKNTLHKNFSNNSFDEYKKTIIGNDVWIGSKCLIKAGVHISDGAIIGMGSVVTHDIPPYEIWAGNPARMIGKRFDDEMICALLNLEWWRWDEQRLSEMGDYFNSPEELLKRVKE